MNNKHYVGKRVSSFTDYNDVGPITGVALVVDEENEYLAGDQSGYVLEMECPYGTQTMANNILSSVRGQTYKGYRAGNAELDMSAELGDGITVNGLYSMLAYRNLTFGPGHMSEIAAPGDSELEHEYPYISSTQREINRKIATTRSLITKTAEEIRLEVQNEVNGLSSEFSVKLDSITSRVNGIDSNVSSIEQYMNSITLSVSNGSTSSTIKLMAGSTEIASENITMNGLVTFTGLANGTTTIDGACIKTGTIDAERLNLTGEIVFSDLASDVQNTVSTAYNTANSAYSTASSAYATASGASSVVSNWTYPGTTYIDGKLIQTGTVEASTLKGGIIEVLGENGSTYGRMYAGTNTAGTTAFELWGNNGLRLTSSANIYISALDGATYVQLTYGDLTLGGGNIHPSSEGSYSCGTASFYWSDVYAANAEIQSSDAKQKENIEYGLDRYDALFDALRPVSFTFKRGSSGRRHIGLIAQDVEESLRLLGISTLDFATFIKSPVSDDDGEIITGEYVYGLRYGELIALCVEQLQRLKSRVQVLEGAQV